MERKPCAERDYTGNKFQRLVFGLLLLLAFVFDQILIVGAVALLMIIFTFVPICYSPIYRLHRYFNSTSQLPIVCVENSKEEAFACSLGAFFLISGIVCYYLGPDQIAWSLVIIVAVLSLLAGTVGFCLGSLIYFWLKKRFDNGR